MSRPLDPTTSFSKGKCPPSPGGSDQELPISDVSDSESISSSSSDTLPKIEIDLMISREKDMLGVLPASRDKYTVKHAKKEFIRRVHQKHGIEPAAVEKAIVAITPFPPLMRDKKDGEMRPFPIPPDFHDRAMEAFFAPKLNHGLLLFEMHQTFPHPSKEFMDSQEEKVKSPMDEGNDVMKMMKVLQDELRENRERLQLETEKMRAEAEKMRAEAEKMRAETENMKAEIEKLQADLTRETARATQAEQALDESLSDQAENMRDANEFIASGCREDTLAYYRIKIRHLVNLVQAELAYLTGLTTSPEEREAAKRWRQHCNTLVDLPANGHVDTKVCQAKRFIRQHRKPKDVAATNALIDSGALEVLVDDSSLRAVGDAAAHPGPLTQANVKGYKDAIKSHADGVGNPVLELHLNGCISYLFTVGNVPP